jgi:hypothetical protein
VCFKTRLVVVSRGNSQGEFCFVAHKRIKEQTSLFDERGLFFDITVSTLNGGTS